MNKIVYNKLVRDRIPEIIHAAGKKCATVVMAEEEYTLALRAKLVEEALEAQQAAPEDLATELADLSEVIDALKEIYGISQEQFLRVKSARLVARGGFTKRIKLIWSGKDDNPQD